MSRQLLDALHLSPYFAAIVGGDSLPVSKPDPAPLHHALIALGAAAGEALMVGDSRVDATAAAAAGMPFLLFEGGYGRDECAGANVFGRFAVFAELFDLIERSGR